MGVVTDVQTHLAAEGIIDGSTEWPSVRRGAHDDSDRLVILTEDGGPEPEIGRLDNSAAIESPGVQVRVRGGPWEGDEAVAKLEEIKEALHGLTGALIGSERYIGVQAMSAGPALFYDENGRPNMTMSFLLTRPVTQVSA